MTTRLIDVIANAKEELEDEVESQFETNDDRLHFLKEPHDRIHEIADGSVPVYTSDLMEMAANDNNLACDEPELGPAFDGSATPVNIIAANVFEAIEDGLWEKAQELHGEVQDLIDQEEE